MTVLIEPIVFVSHNRVKQGKLGALRDFLRDGTALLEGAKPRTRAFADPDAMAAHIEGADQRTEAASAFIETTAIDIYGTPSEPILAAMRQISGSGVALNVRPTYIGGFLRE